MAIRDFAKGMRRNPTKSESRLWSLLRDRRFGDYKFRRQHPVAGYILDFYCAELKLAIEADGLEHETPWLREYDVRRTVRLAAQGIEVLRLSNEVIARYPFAAEEAIRLAIERRASMS